MFYYDYLIPKWNKNNVQLIYTYTNSLAVSIKTHSFQENIKDDIEKNYGTPNYDERRERLLPVRRNVIVLIKDETFGKIITKFAGIAPKTYAYNVQNDDYKIKDSEYIRAEEVKKFTSKKKIFKQYVHDITNIPIIKERTSFRSIIHEVFRVTSNKLAMRNADDKEIQNEDRITSYSLESNIISIKYFGDDFDDDYDDKQICNFVQELKQIYKKFMKNV